MLAGNVGKVNACFYLSRRYYFAHFYPFYYPRARCHRVNKDNPAAAAGNAVTLTFGANPNPLEVVIFRIYGNHHHLLGTFPYSLRFSNSNLRNQYQCY